MMTMVRTKSERWRAGKLAVWKCGVGGLSAVFATLSAVVNILTLYIYCLLTSRFSISRRGLCPQRVKISNKLDHFMLVTGLLSGEAIPID